MILSCLEVADLEGFRIHLGGGHNLSTQINLLFGKF